MTRSTRWTTTQFSNCCTWPWHWPLLVLQTYNREHFSLTCCNHTSPQSLDCLLFSLEWCWMLDKLSLECQQNDPLRYCQWNDTFQHLGESFHWQSIPFHWRFKSFTWHSAVWDQFVLLLVTLYYLIYIYHVPTTIPFSWFLFYPIKCINTFVFIILYADRLIAAFC